MLNSVKTRGLALLATVALLGGTAWIASGTTGAYFSDTHTGAMNGTIGSIQVSTSGGQGADGLDFSFNKMLPGFANTATVKYTNTGANPQDVWIVFNNATALSALNDLGTYGEVHLSGNSGVVFESGNLNDHLDSCHVFFDHLNSAGQPGCWPLAQKYKVADNLAVGATGTAAFTFNYAGKMKAATSAHFNPWPVATQYLNAGSTVVGSGLPYQIVATQHGIDPS